MRLSLQITLMASLGALLPELGWAGNSLPGQGYPASRYETLWTKSPFSVATPEPTEQPSEYSLVGIANLDGVDYASLVNRQSNQSYFLAMGKPQDGLSLVSITHGEDRDHTVAVIRNNGQTLTLKLADALSPPPSPVEGNAPTMANAQPIPGMPTGTNPGVPAMSPRIPMGFPSTAGAPGTGGFPSTAGTAGGGTGMPHQPPVPMLRHPIIHVPPPPQH